MGSKLSALEIGQAAEYLVAADLMLQGYCVTIAAAGLPYDLIVDNKKRLIRVQVKATLKVLRLKRSGWNDVYRFGTRRAKGHRKRFNSDQIDCFAFVALDIKRIAYIPVSEMIGKDGAIKTTMELKSREYEYTGRLYSSGKRRGPWGRFIEDHQDFGAIYG